MVSPVDREWGTYSGCTGPEIKRYYSRRLVGARWLLGWERRLRERVSSVVFFFDGVLPLKKPGVWFGGRLCPVERYEFNRGRLG